MKLRFIYTFLIVGIGIWIAPLLNDSYPQSSISSSKPILSLGGNSSDTSSINIPVQPDRLQFILKNDTSKASVSETQMFGLYGNAITAIGAVGGGIIGSLLTARHNRKIEEQKINQAIRVEQQKINAQKDEEKDFNQRIIAIVYNELELYLRVFRQMMTYSITDNVKDGILFPKVTSLLIDYPRQYPKLSLEKRVIIFDLESLPKIENTYQTLQLYSQGFKEESSKYEDKEKHFKEIVQNLGTFSIMKMIEDTTSLIKKNNPSVKEIKYNI